MFHSGRSGGSILGPLLLALIFGATAAASVSPATAVREGRKAFDRGETPTATAIVEAALLAAGPSDDATVWELRLLRAELFMKGGNRGEALKLLEGPLPPTLRNTELAARRMTALTMLYWYGDEHGRALEKLAEALDVAKRHAPQFVPEALSLRGFLTDNDKDSLAAVRLAEARGDPAQLAKVEGNLAIRYTRSRRYAEAIALDISVRPRLEKLQHWRLLKTHVGNIGWAYYEVGDYEQAARLMALAEREARRMGDVDEQSSWLNHLGNLRFVRHDWKGARAAYSRALTVNPALKHREVGHALMNLARVAIETGDLAEARRLTSRALVLEAKDRDDHLIARILDARIDAASNNQARAEKTLKSVLSQKPDANTRLDAELRLAQFYAADRRTQLAGAAFARSVQLVRNARETVNSRELRISFFNNSTELFDSYIDFLIDTGRFEDALRATESSRAQTLAEGIEAEPTAKLDPRAIARQRGATILCYWLGRRRSYAWTVTPGSVRVTTLPDEATIDARVERYREQLLSRSNTFERSRERGRLLYQMLVAEASRGIAAGSRVIIVPDGKLHTLNFETLVVPSNPDRYWIEDVVLSNASSLQLLSRPAKTAGKPPRMLLIGDPLKAAAAFPELKHASEEIRMIAGQFGGRASVLAGPRATPAAYKSAGAERFEFVHFVAHGIAAPHVPLDSAVILGPDAKRDYRLSAREIANLRLTARLVTISSCDGAGTATYAGEGLVGLAWAFLHAGAQQVIAALWAVTDSAAPKLMERMYAGIGAGQEPAVALRNAKLELLRKKTIHRQARYWAPFVLYM